MKYLILILFFSMNGYSEYVPKYILGNEVYLKFQVDEKTANMRPQPEYIKEWKKDQFKHLYKHGEKAVKDFQEFAKEYQSCINSKKWPEKTECLKNNKRIEYCFNDEKRYPCDFSKYISFQPTCNVNFKGCMTKSEANFDTFSRCLQPNNFLIIRFDFYGSYARKADYYTLRVGGKDVSCQFTVFQKTYQLSIMSDGDTGYDMGPTIIPEKYVK